MRTTPVAEIATCAQAWLCGSISVSARAAGALGAHRARRRVGSEALRVSGGSARAVRRGLA